METAHGVESGMGSATGFDTSPGGLDRRNTFPGYDNNLQQK